MHTIHVSDVTAYKGCRRKFWLSSPLYQGLEAIKPHAPFFTGRVIHTALEDYYMTGLPLGVTTHRAVEVEQARALALGTPEDLLNEMLDEQLPLIYGMMEHYELWINSRRFKRQPFSDPELEFLDMETNFVVPLKNSEGAESNLIQFGGRFDGVVRRLTDGSLWLFETKTTRSIDEFMNSLIQPPQARAYIFAARELLGAPLEGVIYNLLRKKVPTEPRILVNGGLSVAANIDTSLEAFLTFAKNHHANLSTEEVVDLYRDRLEALKAENRYFTRVALRFTDDNIATFGRHLHRVGLEMVRSSTDMYANHSWSNCTFCGYKAICNMLEEGQPWDVVNEALGGAYRVRTDRVLRPAYLLGKRFLLAPLTEELVQVWEADDLLATCPPIEVFEVVSRHVNHVLLPDLEREVRKWLQLETSLLNT